MMKGFLRARPSALCAVAVLTLVPALAHAEDEAKPYPECTREPSDSDTTAAKAAFQAGNVSFNEADYPRAILYWEDAYRRDCTKHQMLLNLARAYELDGQKKQAVMALETFLVREQNAPDRPQITRRIEVLKKQIDNDEAAAQAQKQSAPVTPVGAPAPDPSPVPPPAETSNGQEGSRPILPLVVAGVGGAMFIGGGVLHLTAKSDVDEYASHCGDPERHRLCPEDELDPANAARTRMNVGSAVAGVGGALLVGGLVWYFLSPKETSSASAAQPVRAVVPVTAPGFAGLELVGKF
jgi:tetratricopeptide (TPR) repeat protein